MEIRLAGIGDAAALLEIYAYYVERFAYSFEYEAPSIEEFTERIVQTKQEFPYFVCEEKGEILGFAYAHQFRERKAYQWICETSIYVKNGSAQKGVGTLLYQKLLPALKRQGYAKALASLGCPNEGSERFHQKMGFSLIATLPGVGYKLGGWHDIKYYMLELNPVKNEMKDPVPYSLLERE